MQTKPDITLPADIRLLIDTFYEKVKNDEVIGYIFNDVANVNWEHHLPVMYAFWEFLLLDNADAYRGNPIQKHLDLHAKHALKAAHFDRWLALFQSSVDELFEGPVAENAKFRAFAISETWKPKFDGPFAHVPAGEDQ
ncbi:MAG: group III truncated hemoglobin [Bacteroidota bacterium]|jgi:hemoglobin|nr:group III truncated hemoglobin [Saprospiraceae bacterium]